MTLMADSDTGPGPPPQYQYVEMADVAVGEVTHSPVFNAVVMERSEICCESCKKLKLELQKTLSGLSSALTINKLLQENENLM
jgi:hypothetical protein